MIISAHRAYCTMPTKELIKVIFAKDVKYLIADWDVKAVLIYNNFK